MRLSLSTAAATDWTLPELLEACGRRGLSGLELVAGHGHGVDPDADTERLSAVIRALEETGVSAVAYRVDSAEEAMDPSVAALSGRLRAPVVVSASALAGVEEGWAELRAWAMRAAATYARWGGELLLEHGSEVTRVEAIRSLAEAEGSGTLGLAWEALPEDPRFGSEAAAVLSAAGPALRHIRLRGGGPEAVEQEGQGIGALMARLALGGYRGALAITPSTDRYRVAWSTWLGRRGWGCGGKASDDALVVLDPATVERG